MATTDNYIDIFITADAKELKNGLADAERSIKAADSSFKANVAGMENWQKSTEGIKEKVKQLTDVLEVQRKKEAILSVERDRSVDKLNKLQQEYDEAVASGNAEKKVLEQLAYRLERQKKATGDLTVKYNKQVAVTKTTDKELTNYKNTLQQAEDGTIDLEQVTLKAGKAVDKLGNEANESGSKLDTLKNVAGGVAKGVAVVGAAGAAAIGSFLALGPATQEAREDMTKLTSSFTGAGLSGESAKKTYTDLYKVIGETDTAVEAAQQIALLANSEEEAAKWASQAANVTATFGDALKPETYFESANETLKLGKATGAFAQMLEGTGVNVEEFDAHLASLTTEQEKQAYMLEVSEKAMGKAGEAYEESAKSIMAAREAEAQLALATQNLGAVAEPIMTTVNLLLADLLESALPFVELLGGGLTDAMNGVEGGAEKMAEGLGGLLGTLVDSLADLLPTAVDLVVELTSQILTVLLDSLPKLLPVVINGFLSIVNGLSEMLPILIEKIMEILPILIQQLIGAIPQLIQAAITLLMAIVDSIPVIIVELINALPGIIDSIISALLESYPMLIDASVKLLMSLVDAIPLIIDALILALPTIVESLVEGILDAIPLLLQAAIKMWWALIQAIPTLILELIRQLPKIWTSIYNAISGAKDTLFKKAKEFFAKLPEAIPTIISKVQTEIQKLIDKMNEKFKGIGDSFKKFGEDVVKGLWNGINDKVEWIKKKISGFVGDVKGFFTKFFGIESPSKLMRDTVGMFIGEGIGEGIVDSLPFVKKDIDEFSNRVANDLSHIKGGLTLNNNSGTNLPGQSVNGGVVNNFTQIVNAPKQPKLEDMYRYTGNLLDLKGGVV